MLIVLDCSGQDVCWVVPAWLVSRGPSQELAQVRLLLGCAPGGGGGGGGLCVCVCVCVLVAQRTIGKQHRTGAEHIGSSCMHPFTFGASAHAPRVAIALAGINMSRRVPCLFHRRVPVECLMCTQLAEQLARKSLRPAGLGRPEPATWSQQRRPCVQCMVCVYGL